MSIYMLMGHAQPSDGIYLCGYAVVSDTGEIIEAFVLDYYSARAAELVVKVYFIVNSATCTVHTCRD